MKNNMIKVTLISYTAEPEKTIALAAKTCYSSVDIQTIDTDRNIEEFLHKLRSMSHYSPFEHAQFTFAITGISRACSHQLVRHRLASYSQRSQRYVSEVAPNFIVPDSIYNSSMLMEYRLALNFCLEFYKKLKDNGIPDEDARYILPNATDTQLVMSMNARELIHVCRIRMCNRAQDEIQNLFISIAGILMNRFPLIFKGQLLPICMIEGKCPEGDYQCKRPLPQEIKEMV